MKGCLVIALLLAWLATAKTKEELYLDVSYVGGTIPELKATSGRLTATDEQLAYQWRSVKGDHSTKGRFVVPYTSLDLLEQAVWPPLIEGKKFNPLDVSWLLSLGFRDNVGNKQTAVLRVHGGARAEIDWD